MAFEFVKAVFSRAIISYNRKDGFSFNVGKLDILIIWYIFMGNKTVSGLIQLFELI